MIIRLICGHRCRRSEFTADVLAAESLPWHQNIEFLFKPFNVGKLALRWMRAQSTQTHAGKTVLRCAKVAMALPPAGSP